MEGDENENQEKQGGQQPQYVESHMKKQMNQGNMINKRSISGASNTKNQMNFGAMKGQSQTPKSQNFQSGIQNYRGNNMNGIPRQNNGMNNMTQVINIKDHLPSDLKAGANQGNMHHQRLYMAQQKLAKQLKVNTTNESFLRYGNSQKGGQNIGLMMHAGNITTTASQQKSQGPSLFHFN